MRFARFYARNKHVCSCEAMLHDGRARNRNVNRVNERAIRAKLRICKPNLTHGSQPEVPLRKISNCVNELPLKEPPRVGVTAESGTTNVNEPHGWRVIIK